MNYAQLQTEIADLLHRSNLTSKMPGFISRAEARLNRVLTLRAEEKESTLASVTSSRFIALPSNYNKPVALWVDASGVRQPMVLRLPANLCYVSTSGFPEEWAIDGTNIAFDKPADQVYTVYLRYVAKFGLSDSVTTNWLLTNHPDVYLYASAIESAPWLGNDARLATWTALFEKAVRELNTAEGKGRTGGNLQTETQVISRSNILQG